MNNSEKIMQYLLRLKNKENIDEVKRDFIKEFSDIDSKEIIKAEEQLIKSGVPIQEIKELCDIHSSLFHGLTNQEKVKNNNGYHDKASIYKQIISDRLHPLTAFHNENMKINDYLNLLGGGMVEIKDLKNISSHYAKKGDLIYPLLKTKYNVTGPSDVMWTVDDEIRDDINKLLANKDNIILLEKIIKRAKEMIYKEENILFPICAVKFTDEDWIRLSYDAKDYDPIFNIENLDYKKLSLLNIEKNTDEIILSGGHLKLHELDAMLNTLPFEISFVDVSDYNRYFNIGEKYFKRPTQAIDREVYSCHPPKVEAMVRGIITDFKAGKKDYIQVWMQKKDIPMLVSYYAVRSVNNEYIGTMEIVQNMDLAKQHFTK